MLKPQCSSIIIYGRQFLHPYTDLAPEQDELVVEITEGLVIL